MLTTEDCKILKDFILKTAGTTFALQLKYFFNNEWICDLEATQHMSGSVDLFINLKKFQHI